MLRSHARADDFARELAMPRDLVDQALAQLEAEGQILRGQFTAGAAEVEWCHRRLLARIHRLTIGRLRREIEPVTTAEFYAFLNRWQHLAPGHAAARRGRHAAGDPAVAGLGIRRRRLGDRDSAAPHREVRARITSTSSACRAK